MSKLTDFLTGGSDEPKELEGEEEFYTTSKEEFHNTNGMAGADYLKNRSAVVVNLKRVTPDQAKRIIDFLSGTIYAIGGQLQKLGGGIFLATPNNYNIEGTITDEKAEKVARNGNGKKASDDEADFF